jgi:hypothetical protein
MVALYVAGQRVGTLAEAERLLPGLIAGGVAVELRDTAGTPIATVVPVGGSPAGKTYVPPFANDPAFAEFLDACAEARQERDRAEGYVPEPGPPADRPAR